MIIPASEGNSRFPERTRSWVYLLAALALTWNAAGLNRPVGNGGPMALDLSPIGECLSLLAGLGLLRFGPFADRRFHQWGFLAATLILAVPAVRNFYAYPPIMDGAYFIGRYGRGSELWPADAVSHAIAASGFIGAIYGFIRFSSRPLPDQHYGQTITAVVFLTCSFSFAFLMGKASDALMFGRSLGVILGVPLLTGGVSLFWIRRSRAALVVLLHSAVFFVLIGALPILFEL